MLPQTLYVGLLLYAPAGLAAPGADAPKATGVVGASNIAAWGLGLLVVLSVFLFCVWCFSRLSGLPANPAEKMRVIGGLSLGMREKIMLLQVGKKQLILAVTPGRIETLLVLEGDDCLLREDAKATGFAQKLMQAMKARPDE
ncbi:MAG: flagellar biosynthetic protein FliO [Methylovulum sp.]|nr:flagellar biosynthetic protein FliO [Methylovulum sp.]